MSEGFLRPRFGGLVFGRAYFFFFLFFFFFFCGGGGELIIGTLRYSVTLIVKFVVRVPEVIANDYRNVTVESP